jgi:choline dehydrogenase-like flavoprotein
MVFEISLSNLGTYNQITYVVIRIYVRSLPSDFERWNLTGWTWDHILPLYRGMETFIDTAWDDILATLLKRGGSNSSDRPKYSWRGNAGPVVTVPSGPRVDAVAPLFVESAIANGIPRAANGFNHPDSAKRIGAGFYEFNIRNGIRGSIAEAFLGERSKHPPNLEIRTGVTVTRVLMHSLNRAAGVEYVDGEEGAIHRFMLNTSDQNAEVILASGAIMTPQLLANSGIGENGTVADLPGVGKNLQDHPVVAMTFSISPELAEAATSIYTVADEMEDYFVAVAELERNRLLFGAENASALLSLERITSRLGTISTAGFSAGAFLKSPWADTANDKAAPDIQLTVFPRVIEPHVTSHQKNEDKTVTRSSAMLVTIALLQPEGRYQVYPANYEAAALFWDSIPPISSPVMPLTDNVLYPLPTIKLPVNCTEYLTDRDVLRLAWGVEQVRSILSTPPLSTKTGHELYPGSHITGTLLNDHVRQHNLPNSHWVGSTKMGADHDPLAVVDEKLRVRGGVTGLRIVDSGVFPYAPNGNTHSTVCVVASRAADMIVQGRSEEDT